MAFSALHVVGNSAVKMWLSHPSKPYFAYPEPQPPIVPVSARMSTAAEVSPHSALPDRPIILSSKEHSCLRCAQRKVKCDRNFPCSNCKKSQVECVSVTPAAPRRRKRKLPEEDLLARLKLYEELLKSHGVDFESYNGPEKTQPSAPDTCGERDKDVKKEASPSLQAGKLIIEHGVPRYVDK